MSDPIRINSTNNNKGIENRPVISQTGSQDADFSEALENAKIVKFSNHAQKRLDDRSITMDGQDMKRLLSALDKAEAKGSRELLILMDDMAFIVNVPERKVVTTVRMNNQSDGVFTQIDSVVLADKK